MEDDDLYVMINAHWEDHGFKVPDGPSGKWLRVVDTAQPAPQDIFEPGREPKLDDDRCTVRARSLMVLRKERG